MKKRTKRKVSLDDLTEEQIQELLDQYQAKQLDQYQAKHSQMRQIKAFEIPQIKESRRPRKVLDDADVEAIRKRYAEGGITLQQLADQYGVSLGYVWQITKARVRK